MKTSTQFQRITPWARGTLRELGASWVKYINPPAGDNPCPEVPHALVRIWTDDRDSQYISKGYDGGRQFVRDMLLTWYKTPWATAYELANEPDCNSPTGLANLREYSIGAMEEANVYGIKLCILNLAEGNPGADAGLTGDAARTSERWKLAQLADAVKTACAHGHYIGLHAYWKPGVCPDGPADRWHALGRRIWDVEQWATMGIDVSKLHVLINECGIDGGIAGGSLVGWRGLLGDPSAYVEQMCQAEEIACQYPWMEALLYFISGSVDNWQSYEVDDMLLRAVQSRIAPPVAINIENKILQAAWETLQVPYNGSAMFSKIAHTHALGAPLAPEQDIILGNVVYRYQPFAHGIVYSKVGDWDNCKIIQW